MKSGCDVSSGDAVPARILCLSFSDISHDARVLRQLEVLNKYGQVTTVGFGPKPPRVAAHIEVPGRLKSLPQTALGVARLALRRYRSAELTAPALAYALNELNGKEYDIVVANDARAVPLAFQVSGDPKIWCDLHEWAPAENKHLSWRLLIGPFMYHICKRYLPAADATTTVNQSIANLYQTHFGVIPRVVKNAGAYRRNLSPKPVGANNIKLVHSGIAIPSRNILTLVKAMNKLDERFTLDLYLIPGNPRSRYWRNLKRNIDKSPSTVLHTPVPTSELAGKLNDYDIGVFLYAPSTLNGKFMLPNKLFDYVQARLCVIFSSAPETDALISKYNLGYIAKGADENALVEVLQNLAISDIEIHKQASDKAAREMSSETEVEVENQIMKEFLGYQA